MAKDYYRVLSYGKKYCVTVTVSKKHVTSTFRVKEYAKQDCSINWQQAE